jgi:hypothetical protein
MKLGLKEIGPDLSGLGKGPVVGFIINSVESLRWLINSSPFMKLEGSYAKPDEFIPQPDTLFHKDLF